MNYFDMKITLRPNPDHRLHPFIGSMLRGAFGHALKDTVCVHPKRECTGCFAASGCLYAQYYESELGSALYRFDYRLYVSKPDFGLILFGEEQHRHIPYVLSAVARMVEKIGLGAERARYAIESIHCNGALLHNGKSFTSEPIAPRNFTPDLSKATRWNILLETPLRMKFQNRFLRENIPSLEVLLQSIHNKRSEILGEPKSKLAILSGEIVSQQVRFEDFGRYSNKQKTKMLFGGLLGSLRIEDVDEKGLELLRLGELIGVGKSTVFGLGKITLEEVA